MRSFSLARPSSRVHQRDPDGAGSGADFGSGGIWPIWIGAAAGSVAAGEAYAARAPAPGLCLTLRGRLRRRSAGKPGVDQVELVGRQVEALAAAARHHEVAEAAGEQVGRRALLEPRIGLAHHLEHEAHVVAPHAPGRAPGRAG